MAGLKLATALERARRERDEWKQKAIAVDGRIRALEGERDEAQAQRDALRQAAHDAYAHYETWSLTGDGAIDMARAMERLQALASGEEE